MRYVIVFSTVFAVFGVILVSISGSLLMVPYTVREPFRVDRAKTWVNDTFALMPSKNRTYYLDSVAENVSIIQVDVDSSDFIVLKIISDANDKLWFERETRWTRTSYWTPPSLGYGIWRFVFHNPSSTQVNLTVKIREFYFKVTEYREVTYYHPALDQTFAYVGIIAITFGLLTNSAYNIYLSRQERKIDSA